VNKIERVQAALQGKDVDRIPYSMWYHFGTQFLPGEVAADTQIAFYERYDFDYLKVMNDYSYPLPEGLDRISSLADWQKLRPVPVSHPCFQEQLKLLEKIARRLDGEAYFLDTVFNPIGVAMRTAKDVIFRLMRSHPEDFKRGLETITESLLGYIEAVYKAGAAGIFYSVNGATDDFTPQAEFAEFIRPYDLQILNAVKDKGACNVVHIHGINLRFADVADYPTHAFNWSHIRSAPSLAEARKMTDVCLIGGVSELRTDTFHPDVLEKQIRDSFAEAGERKFMVGPGCAIPTDTSPEQIDIIRRTVAALK